MLSDLGVSPTSVSEAHAVSVFDAVVRNGLPDTDPARGRELHGDGVFDGYYVDRGDRGNEGSVGGVATVKGVNMGWKTQRRRDDTLHREDSRLCWSLFLEAMVSKRALVGEGSPTHVVAGKVGCMSTVRGVALEAGHLSHSKSS